LPGDSMLDYAAYAFRLLHRCSVAESSPWCSRILQLVGVAAGLFSSPSLQAFSVPSLHFGSGVHRRCAGFRNLWDTETQHQQSAARETPRHQLQRTRSPSSLGTLLPLALGRESAASPHATASPTRSRRPFATSGKWVASP